MTTIDVNQIKKDRMRFTKNTLSANLVLLAIVFDVLYFVNIYQTNATFYYAILIGASIIYNLVFMLAAFLCSEGVKSRKGNYLPMLLALGIGQFVRMFILPLQAHTTMIKGTSDAVMGNGQYIYVMICLAISGASCLVAGVTSFLQNKTLNDYMKSIEQPK